MMINPYLLRVTASALLMEGRIKVAKEALVLFCLGYPDYALPDALQRLARIPTL